mmetsp:Transcript_16654/g.49837  ORF Transcript_16654/g.49837 Transcript_16654/m.49837 type:complete len:230 (+) Transcript_16654:390-1079(+)|eukprot:365011-Chlamydomonas_euryale.AAC.34
MVREGVPDDLTETTSYAGQAGSLLGTCVRPPPLAVAAASKGTFRLHLTVPTPHRPHATHMQVRCRLGPFLILVHLARARSDDSHGLGDGRMPPHAILPVCVQDCLKPGDAGVAAVTPAARALNSSSADPGAHRRIRWLSCLMQSAADADAVGARASACVCGTSTRRAGAGIGAGTPREAFAQLGNLPSRRLQLLLLARQLCTQPILCRRKLAGRSRYAGRLRAWRGGAC